MSLRFRCPACQGVITANDEHAGGIVACPGCTRPVRLPAAPQPTTYAFAADPEPPPIRVSPPVRIPPPVQTAPAVDPEPEDDPEADVYVPPRRRKGPPMVLIAAAAVLFLAGAIGVLAYAVWTDTNDRPGVGTEPARKGDAPPKPADPTRKQEQPTREPGAGLPRWGDPSADPNGTGKTNGRPAGNTKSGG